MLKNDYMTRLTASKLWPNFWVSERYWDYAKWSPRSAPGNGLTLMDEEGTVMLPTLDPYGRQLDAPYWACLIGQERPAVSLFLDHNFIYHPIQPSDLVGGMWRDVRKALSRVNRETGVPEGGLTLDSVKPGDDSQIVALLEGWAGSREDIYDPELMARFLLENPDRGVIRSPSNPSELLAVLAWDTNPWAVNFRYCFVKPGLVGLSEYARTVFRMWVGKAYPGMFINDGGSLDRDDLRKFKCKLNPNLISPIWSKE